MGAASGGLDAFDGRSTSATRLALSAVDLVPELKPAPLAGRCAIVADGAAAGFDRSLEYAAHDSVKAFDWLIGKLACDSQWMDARSVQRLIDVDVTQPTDRGLIQQQRFDLAIPSQQSSEVSQGDFQRVGTERSQTTGSSPTIFALKLF